MSDTTGVGSEIVFENVWKKFHRGEFHDSLRDLIPSLAKSLLSGGRSVAADRKPGEFWALQDVTFRVGPGEALGIIGPNGAGKSTTLKLLTGILRPTRGQCRLEGRIGALIEIAAGFHPDLTGRENIYLQGTIMGMPRAQIREQFDRIVEFSGLESFLDMPVKRYSSGMNARLGFSIAAHLQPEVLVIDEVLSVGDINFQTRAFSRLKEIVRSGIPVVVVSHQLDRIAELCTRAILLEQGRVAWEGSPEECIRRYMSPGDSAAEECTHGIRSIDFPDGGRVQSGERLRVHVVVTRDAGHPANAIEPLALLVRSSQTGAVVAAVGTSTCRVEVPADQPTLIDASLQMNVPAGIYIVETVLWDRKTDQVIAKGPAAAVVVEEGVPFSGYVQLNARMTAEPASSTDSAEGLLQARV
jgi:ABC-type polysaccharide/polyol phosphate transport system ATPase subunit